MPTKVIDPPVLVNTVIVAGVADHTIQAFAVWLGQAGGIGYFADSSDVAIPVGPRMDATAGATQLSWSSPQGEPLFEAAEGEDLIWNNGFSAGSINSHVVLCYELVRTTL